jgi:hypothetical protein
LDQIKKLLRSELRIEPSTWEEEEKDRQDARVLLASEVLDGRIDFARDIEPGSYGRLENCWLQDVKDSKAYLLWLARGGTVDEARSEGDYVGANVQIMAKLLDAATKAPDAEFASVRDYLNQRYLTDGQLDLEKPETKPLIRNKATRLSQKRPGNRDENRLRAVEYVVQFYENIIPAVGDNSPEHVRRVVEALEVQAWRERADIVVNCFEMAIAIYFLNAATVRAALELPKAVVS